ncbi:MAG TPA: branched-chain amino acid ABC transporter permease [Burkholderiales bacterium]|nr:branched-chain amino acid ABC transporter permease [Burkholderiales bacterium]
MNEFLTILVDSVIYTAWLFIAAVGLTLIYGVMKIINVAHGSFYALGAYMATTVAGWWIRAGHAPMLSYVALLVAAVLVGFVIGPIVERLFLARNYSRDEVVIMLITYALFLILEDAIKLVWGVDPYYLPEPYSLLGTIDIGDLSYPVYDVLRAALALVVGVALAFVLTRMRVGKLLVAVIHDREVSASMGINVRRMYVLTFAVGCTLAALGGALTAPTLSVVPALGVDVIVLSFAVVVIGGMGSLPGAAIGAAIVGLVRSISVHYMPEAELFIIYFVMAMVLTFRPRGLFMAPEARRI